MVLGILGLVICPVVGIVAWNLSGKALREIDANPGLYSDRNNVVLGKWLGIVGIIVWSLILIVYVIVVAAASVSSS